MTDSIESTVGPEPRLNGCVMALILAFVIIPVLGLGWLWLFTLLPDLWPVSRMQAILIDAGRTVGFGGLLLPGSLVALRLLKKPSLRLLRGVALSMALLGGYAMLHGTLLTLDRGLHYPGLPALAAPVLMLLAAGVGLYILRDTMLTRTSPGAILLGAGMGLFVTLPWLWAGTLGTVEESLIALVDAGALALMAAIVMSAVFHYDHEYPVEHPFWSVVLAGIILAAAMPGLVAGRGWWLQGIYLALGTLLTGWLAARLARRTDEESGIAGLPALAFLFVGLLIPLLMTDGLDGDWMYDELSGVWIVAVAIALGLKTVGLGIVSLLNTRRTAEILGPITAAVSVMLAFTLYIGIGQPGFTPDTFMVVLVDQADTSPATEITDRDERVTMVYHTLTEHADTTQADLRRRLDMKGIRYTPHYLVNAVEIEGGSWRMWQVSRRSDVAWVVDAPHPRPLPASSLPMPMSAEVTTPNLTWGVDSIDADVAWEDFGITGEGIIVGIADSGVDWQHPAILDSYLGRDAASHDYTWLDPWENSPAPVDENGHGTHTTGTVTGNPGIGVAPDAEWIACRNLGRNLGNPATYLTCMEFLFAPYPQDETPFAGDPTRGAHITSNSWGCPPEEGCDNRTLAIGVAQLRSAGQMFVVSAGNAGPACETIWAPASADAALSVGASAQGGGITGFSSRGPAQTANGTYIIKPDILAPGSGVLSSVPGGGYGYASGTSMAGPHIAGVVALMWSADLTLIGDIDRTEDLLFETADNVYDGAGTECGGEYPANNSGHGLVDVDEILGILLGQ